MKPGDIFNTEGDILLESNARGMLSYAKAGVLAVTMEQAEKAKPYGWSLVKDPKYNIPAGLVGIRRNTVGGCQFEGG